MAVARSIVAAVRATFVPPGRFLQQDPSTGRWFDIGDAEAIEKTLSAFRSGALEDDAGNTDLFSFEATKANGKPASEGKRKFDDNEEEPQVNVRFAMAPFCIVLLLTD
jgi:hypothetical protein